MEVRENKEESHTSGSVAKEVAVYSGILKGAHLEMKRSWRQW